MTKEQKTDSIETLVFYALFYLPNDVFEKCFVLSSTFVDYTVCRGVVVVVLYQTVRQDIQMTTLKKKKTRM
jgi:hypothetical protein